MAAPRDFSFRPGHKVQYARDHPLPDSDSDSDNSIEYYEEEEETASDCECEEEEDDDDEDGEVEYEEDELSEEKTEAEEADDEEIDDEQLLQNEEEIEVIEGEAEIENEEESESDDNMPNQSRPLVPFALAPGHVATSAGRKVICPVCPPGGNNEYHHRSMPLHFARRHPAHYVQTYGVPPPTLYPCPYAGPNCTSAPFKRRIDRDDHLSEKHNVVPAKWRKNMGRQKRRKAPNLIADHAAEAGYLNALIGRIATAEAGQPQPYVSQHGLPLVYAETDPARITDRSRTVAIQKQDVAPKLIALRDVADMVGVLLGGGTGTWEQVAAELEARVPGIIAAPVAAPVAGPSTAPAQAHATDAGDKEDKMDVEEGEVDAEGEVE